MKRRKWTDPEKRELVRNVVDLMKTDGLSKKEACKKIKVNDTQFYKWRIELGMRPAGTRTRGVGKKKRRKYRKRTASNLVTLVTPEEPTGNMCICFGPSDKVFDAIQKLASITGVR